MPQIGTALMGAGLIVEEQLLASLERQKKHPYLTLGQLISLMHKIPMSQVDAVSIRYMTLPLVGPALLQRLTKFAEKDRFAKRLDPSSFVKEVVIKMLEYEMMHIDARRYDEEGGEIRTNEVRRYVLTQGKVQVDLHTVNGEKVPGTLRIKQDSISHVLEITDPDDFVKAEFYYELRRYYTRTSVASED